MTYAQAGEINGMVPPQAVELEKSVLGALMLNQEALFGHIYDMHEGLFYKTEHQVIFSCFTLWSITCREASSLWISSKEIPASIIMTMT